MGTYLNPGNSGFAEILQSDYVDKTGLISLINSTIGTKKINYDKDAPVGERKHSCKIEKYRMDFGLSSDV